MSQFPKFLRRIALTAVVAGCVGAGLYAAAPQWLLTVTVTERGSHVLGNPTAPTKIVEYASYTCPHCAHFENVDAPLVKKNLIATGKASFEMRNYLLNTVDMTVAMLARCGGKGRFFGNHQYFMATQKAWLANAGKVSAATKAKLEAENYTGYMNGVFDEMKLAPFAAKRGITVPQARKCFTDEPARKQIFAMTQEAAQTYRVGGTPTFMINGKVDEGIYDYATLKARASN